MTTLATSLKISISQGKTPMLNTDLCIDTVLAVVEKNKHHQRIISINKKMREKGLPKFSFHFVTLDKTLKQVALLSDKKASQSFRYSC